VSGTLLSDCGVLYIDHLAYTTPDLDKTLAEFLSLPQTRLVKGPGWNPDQKVRYAFVQQSGGYAIELLSGGEGSPVFRHIKQGGGLYHFCYAVADMEFAVAKAKQLGAALVSPPTPDVAFDGRRVVFLMHKLHGVFELVEAYPADQPYAAPKDTASIPEMLKHSPAAPKTDAAANRTEARLLNVFAAVFPALTAAEARSAAINETKEWNSLAQIQLMMEVELEFEVQFSPGQIAQTGNFSAILALLEVGKNR
jgi:catechol 2,3-dioxygenase-like lactoylglutathione lyase family enzyme